MMRSYDTKFNLPTVLILITASFTACNPSSISNSPAYDPEQGITADSRFMLGINLADSADELILSFVMSDSPASLAGLKPGDILDTINGHQLKNMSDLKKSMQHVEEYSTVPCEVLRNGERINITIKFTESIPMYSVKEPSGPVHDPGDTSKIKNDDPDFSAIKFLIGQQKANGRWPASLLPSDDSALGATVAVTALTAITLIDAGDLENKEIQSSIQRALAFIDRWVYKKSIDPQDFSICQWGQVYTLQLLNKLINHPHWKKDSKKLKTLRKSVLNAMLKRQRNGGGWGYNSSFQTAVTIQTLTELQEESVVFDKNVLNSSLLLFESLRIKGLLAYKYSLTSQPWSLPQDRDAAYRDAAMRLALCSHVSYNHGRQTKIDLKNSITIAMKHFSFFEHWRKIKNPEEGAKLNLPFRRGSQTPYFFFHQFGCYYTAMAMHELKNDPSIIIQAKKLLQIIDDYRNSDGTWTCMEYTFHQNSAPENKVFATAMNLRTKKILAAIVSKNN